MSAPTNTYLPTPVSVQQGAALIVTGASEPAKEKEIYNLSYFLTAMQAALAANTTYAGFAAAMLALPQNP
jgi:hypothetical protein